MLELGLDVPLGFDVRDVLDVLRQTLTRNMRVPGTPVLDVVGSSISSKPSMSLENSDGFAYVR